MREKENEEFKEEKNESPEIKSDFIKNIGKEICDIDKQETKENEKIEQKEEQKAEKEKENKENEKQ
jgi:hypothetical protein